MEVAVILFIFILILLLIIFMIEVPIMIAKSRGISGSELTTITLLSWFSLLIGITWFIALILSLVYHPKNWVDKDQGSTNLNLEALEKLHELRQKGVLSEADYKREKAKLMGKQELEPAPQEDNLDKLEKLQALKKKGVLTQKEFEQEKAKLLA